MDMVHLLSQCRHREDGFQDVILIITIGSAFLGIMVVRTFGSPTTTKLLFEVPMYIIQTNKKILAESDTFEVACRQARNFGNSLKNQVFVVKKSDNREYYRTR